jgi:acyl-CoA thioester hydrolase
LLEHGSDLFVVRSVIDYHRSAEYDDEIDVCVRVARIGRSSMPFALEIWRGEDHLVSGEVVYVNADPQTRRSAPVPDFLRDAVSRLEGRDVSA